MQKFITLLSSFQATMQDYNKSHDAAAARGKGKMGNDAVLRKALGTSKGLWILLQEYYQQVVKGLEAPEGSWLFSIWASLLLDGQCPTSYGVEGWGEGERLGESLAQGDQVPVQKSSLLEGLLMRSPPY